MAGTGNGYLTFISHSGEDTWIARKLSDDCKAAGASVFLDEEHIAIGSQFEQDLRKALKSAKELVVVATPWALERRYVWMEIGAAWFREIPIIVLLTGVSPEQFRNKANIPIALQERNFVPLNEVDRYLAELRDRVNVRR